MADRKEGKKALIGFDLQVLGSRLVSFEKYDVSNSDNSVEIKIFPHGPRATGKTSIIGFLLFAFVFPFASVRDLKEECIISLDQMDNR